MENEKKLVRSGPIVINTSRILRANIEAIVDGEPAVAVWFDDDEEPVVFTGGDAQEVASILMAESTEVKPSAY